LPAAFALSPSRFARGRRRFRDGSHLLNGVKERPFIKLSATLVTQRLHGIAVFPQSDGGT